MTHRSNQLVLTVVITAAMLAAGCGTQADTPSVPIAPSEVSVPLPADAVCEPAPGKTGLPFQISPHLSAAGFGLNTNDNGVQDFGEIGVDCGGAGASACTDVALDVQIESDVLLPPEQFAGFRFHLAEGTLNGHAFQMVYPEPEQPELTRSNSGIVIEWPTRRGSPHGAPLPYILNTLVPGQELGATAIAFPGPTGGHPYVFSAQLAVLASRYLREKRGLDTVIVTGSSYGAAAALIDAALYPHLFDGALAVHAPYDGRAFFAMSELGALRSAASGGPIVHALFYSARDAMDMAANQAGLSLDNLDLTLAGNAKVPTIVILGEVDAVWYPGWRVAEDVKRMEQEGIDWVRIKNIPEAGHGGIESGHAVLTSAEELFQMIDKWREEGRKNEPATCRRKRSMADDYDQILRGAPVLHDDPRVTELWSNVTMVEPGTSASAVLTSGGSLFTGSLQGFLTRRSWKDGAFHVDWSVPVGRAIESIDQIGNVLVVGSKRGLALVDAATGALLRETTGIGTVTDVEIGDLIPDVAGLEIAARADQDRLHVESLDGGKLLSATTIGTGGVMRFAKLDGQEARLFVSLSRGFVAGMTFVKNDSDKSWVPRVDWLSEYLANDVTTLLVTKTDAGEQLAVGGEAYGTTPTLFLVNGKGYVTKRYKLGLWNAETIAHWGGSELLVGGHASIRRIDLATGDSKVFSVTDGTHVVTMDVDADGQLEMIGFKHKPNSAPSIVVRDHEGKELWRQTGRVTSPAMDVSYNADAQHWELSVMDRAWRVDRFNLRTGAALGSTPSLRPAFIRLPPRRLVRVADSPQGGPRYQAFLHDGDVAGGVLRAATRCGSWVAGLSIDDEQTTLLAAGDASHQACAQAESNNNPPAGAVGVLSNRLGNSQPNLASTPAGALRFADIDGPASHGVMSTGGGQVALYSVAAGEVEPSIVRDIAGTHTSLATGQIVARPIVAVGSWLRNAAGHSLQLLKAHSLEPFAAIDAGYVVGTALADLDNDGIDEVLVGTQDGWLRIYDHQLRLILQWSAGDLNLGENGALFVAQTANGPVVAFAVSGGWRVLQIKL